MLSKTNSLMTKRESAMRLEKKQRFVPVTDKDRKCGDIIYQSYRGTTIYVLRGRHGDMLIDCGLFHVRKALIKWADQFDIKYIFLTHAHADHDWNAAELKKRYGAKIILNANDLELRHRFASQPLHATRKKYLFKNFYLNITGRLFPSPKYKPDIIIRKEGTSLLRKLGFDAQTVFLPGHTAGMTAILSGDVLYCGDAFTALFYEPEIPPYAADISTMKKSLRKICAVNPRWLACGHGLPVKMPDARKVIRRYLNQGK